MTNQEIALTFRKIADRLELEGDNPYRIRAYRRGATNLERLEEQASDIIRRGQGTKIPGIGKDLEQKIIDLIETGKLRDPVTAYAGSRKNEEIPIRVPGLDPKIARLLYHRFHIRDLEDLERLARSHLLRTLPGTGLKMEKDILKGLEQLKGKGSRDVRRESRKDVRWEGKKAKGKGP